MKIYSLQQRVYKPKLKKNACSSPLDFEFQKTSFAAHKASNCITVTNMSSLEGKVVLCSVGSASISPTHGGLLKHVSE